MTRPLPKVAASSLPSDPLRPAIEARSDAQPMTPWGAWIIDEPDFDPENIPGAGLAFHIFAWGVAPLAIVMVVLGLVL